MGIDFEKKFILQTIGKLAKRIQPLIVILLLSLWTMDIFKFIEEDSQVKFECLILETKDFTNSFEDETPLLKQINKWRQVLL